MIEFKKKKMVTINLIKQKQKKIKQNRKLC